MPQPRRLRINERFFESIDTEARAYALGFLYADGCNLTKRGRVTLALKAEDRVILEAIRDAMEADHPVRIRTYARNDGYSPHTGGMKTMAYLEINSRKLSDDLVKLGCGAAKTDRLRFPRDVPKPLWRHFLRGFFDGDGCITKSRKGRHVSYIATVISNPAFIQDLVGVLQDQFGKPYFVSKSKTKTHTLMMGGNVKTLEFLSWLYDGCTIRLERKWLLYRGLVTQSATPRLHHSQARAVTVFDPGSGASIETFPSHVAAAKWLNRSDSAVDRACSRENGTVAGYPVRHAA